MSREMIINSQDPYAQQDLGGPKSGIFWFKKSEAENFRPRQSIQPQMVRNRRIVLNHD